MLVSQEHTVDALVSAALRGELTDAQARRLARQGAEIVTLALPAASKRIAEQEVRIAQQNARITEQNTRLASLQVSVGTPQSTPSTPSAMVRVYTKPSTTRRRKKPGARHGHRGTRRSRPTCIDERNLY